jgi:hypothetical protein
MPFMISLSARTEDTVRRRAAEAGKPADDYVADLVEQAVKRPTLREILAPIHQEVAASGISQAELDQTLRTAIDAVRLESRES